MPDTSKWLDTDAEKFRNDLVRLVAKYCLQKAWKRTTVEQAKNYAMLLASHEDVILPKIDPFVSSVVYDKLANKIHLMQSQGVNIPNDYFFGQRRWWFGRLLATKSRLTKTEDS